MSDESSEPPVDPRIDEMVRMPDSMREIVMNAEFLLDEWITNYLRAQPELYTVVRQAGMTPDQKFHIVMGHIGAFDGDDPDVRDTFMFLRHLYRIRASAARLGEDKLLGALSSAYIQTHGSAGHDRIIESHSVSWIVKEVLADSLAMAHDCLTCCAAPDPGNDGEADDEL